MSSNKDMLENQKVVNVVKLLNNFYKDSDTVSVKNDLLAANLELHITKLTVGDVTSRVEFIHLLSQAMDYTRADPDITKVEKDRLLKIGELIIRILKLPYIGPEKVNTIIAALRVFQEKLLGSQRRSFSKYFTLWEFWVEKILSNYSVIDDVTVFPAPKKGRGSKHNKKDKVTFKKR